VNAFTERINLKSALKAELAALGDVSRGHAGEIHAGIAVRPIGADVLGRLETARVQDRHLRVLLTDLDRVIEIAVAGGEDDLVAARDQPFHDAFDLCRFRNKFEGRRGNAGHVLFDILPAEIHRGVIAKVGGRTDIDEADFIVGLCGRGERDGAEQGERGETGWEQHYHLLL
jgi:hypothetical protein